VAVVAVSLVTAWAGMMLGEVWSILMEVLRVGNGHLSYRTDRIPWVQHRVAAFVSGVIAFWFIGAIRYSRRTSRAGLSSRRAMNLV
jgi:hypothetical protein